jgi:hypothetical protein
MDGFLRGFGVSWPTAAARLNGAKNVSFNFGDVINIFIDNVALGHLLDGRALDVSNPALDIFIGQDRAPLLVVNSSVMSSEFTITVQETKGAGFELDVPDIQACMVGGTVDVTVERASARGLTFKGPRHLGFAFTAVRFHVDEEGRFRSLRPEWLNYDMFAGDRLGDEIRATSGPLSVELDGEEITMLEWDEDRYSEPAAWKSGRAPGGEA